MSKIVITTENMNPRLYVGTYAKYNSGSIAGAWVDLDDENTFWEEAKELHSDEADPEYMFQDFEGFPRSLYHESSIDKRLWEFVALDYDDQAIVTAYWDDVDSAAEVDDARECYEGTFDSEADWAENFMDDVGGLSKMPENLRCYFDYEAYARDCRLGGDVHFVNVDGKVMVFGNR